MRKVYVGGLGVMAALLIARPYLPWGDTDAFADRVMKAVCIGHIVSGAIDPDVPPRDAIALLKGMLDEPEHRG